MEENFITPTEKLIKVTAEKLTELTENNKDYIPPADTLNALAVLLTARANYTRRIRECASSRD